MIALGLYSVPLVPKNNVLPIAGGTLEFDVPACVTALVFSVLNNSQYASIVCRSPILNFLVKR